MSIMADNITPPEVEELSSVLHKTPPQVSVEQHFHVTGIPLPFHHNDIPASLHPSVPSPRPTPTRRGSFHFNRELAKTHPLTFLVAEDNIINRKLLVNMLTKLGYDPETQIYEAYDGADAVAQIRTASQVSPSNGERKKGPVDVILMDLVCTCDLVYARRYIANIYIAVDASYGRL